MPIGYKYVKREADSYVNWAKIGSDMSNMIVKENKDREDKKEALIQAARQDIDTLANAPMGENQDLNAVMAKAANDATEYIKMQEDLFKSGKMRYNDYIHNRQNLRDGYKNLFSVTKDMQADFADKMKRYKDGDASVTEQDIMAMVEGMGDIKNSQIYVNPINGMVSVAKTKTQKINGKDVTVMDSDPNKFMTVNELRNYMKIKIDKFKTSAIDADVEKVGVKVDETMTQGTLTKLGKIVSITNQALVDTLNPNEKKEVANFQAYVTDLANVRVEGDPFAALSILRDYVGANPKTNKPYSISFDKKAAAADPNTVYLQKNSNGTFTPMLNDEQKEVARDFVKRRIYNELDQKREVKATQYRPYAPQYIYDAGKDEEKKDAFAKAWAGFYTAPTTEQKSNYKQSVIGIMNSIGKDGSKVRDIKFDDAKGTTATVVYEDPSQNRKITLKDKNGNPVPMETWMQAGSEFTGPLSDNIMRKYRGSKFVDVGDWTSVVGGKIEPTATTTTAKTIDTAKIKESIPSRLFLKSKVEVLRQLPAMLKDLGYTVQDANDTDNEDNINIIGPDGKTILGTIETDRNTVGYGEQSMKKLLEIIDAAP